MIKRLSIEILHQCESMQFSRLGMISLLFSSNDRSTVTSSNKQHTGISGLFEDVWSIRGVEEYYKRRWLATEGAGNTIERQRQCGRYWFNRALIANLEGAAVANAEEPAVAVTQR